MRVFTALCREARGYMVLSECSYNQACSWLQARLGEPVKVKSDYKSNCTRLEYTDRTFIYDENKGYLIEEDEV